MVNDGTVPIYMAMLIVQVVVAGVNINWVIKKVDQNRAITDEKINKQEIKIDQLSEHLYSSDKLIAEIIGSIGKIDTNIEWIKANLNKS